TPVVLQEQTIRPIGMPNDLVYALPELRKPLRHERDADAPVARLPGPAAIIGPVNAGRGNSDMHSPGVRRMRQDRVQTQAALARHPAWPMGMIEQTAHQRPRFAGILGLEKRGWLHAAIEFVRRVRGPRRDLPDILERETGFRRESDGG